ncbi:MAG: M56 family metallopeptidase, partial [Alistipes sp.]|nr:M56 family metallopeptidase [Alistipes sp.]
MRILLTEALKIVVCSGVLWGAYELLLDRRAPLRWCRRYLLLLPVLAGLIPLLRIPLLPAPAIELEPFDAAFLIEQAPAPVTVPRPFPLAETIIIAVWAAGLLIMIGVMLGQARIIRQLRRDSTISPAGRFRLALTRRRIAPFSFCGTIYLWEEPPPDERCAIIAHESSHLARHHSAERILMECMKALLWWNPFVWLAARRLAEAEEYEADHDVLTQGYDPQKYMDTLFRQLFGYSPDIANGLRNSFTKKRFQMMTNYNFGRHALLRLAGVIPVITGLMCAFSLTTRAAEVRILPVTEQQPSDNEETANRPEPLYVVNGKELQTLEEALTFGRTLGSAVKGTQTRLRKLSPEEGMEKYGEKGRNGVFEFTISASDKASDTQAAAIQGEEANDNDAPATGNDEAPGEEQPFLVAETMPKFQGGDLSSFRMWVMQRVRYPQEAMNR